MVKKKAPHKEDGDKGTNAPDQRSKKGRRVAVGTWDSKGTATDSHPCDMFVGCPCRQILSWPLDWSRLAPRKRRCHARGSTVDVHFYFLVENTTDRVEACPFSPKIFNVRPGSFAEECYPVALSGPPGCYFCKASCQSLGQNIDFSTAA